MPGGADDVGTDDDAKRRIPRPLRRAVLVEAGHRCAIPTCRQIPVDIDHIDDWSKVREHTFSNLIALCPTCHARKARGDIDRQSMLQYKANLGLLHSRYGELERRLIEMWTIDPEFVPALPRALNPLLWHLKRDGMIEEAGVDGLRALMRNRDSEWSQIRGVYRGKPRPWLWYIEALRYHVATPVGLSLPNRIIYAIALRVQNLVEWRLTPAGQELVDHHRHASAID